jgi:hypothetical protein
MHAPEAFGMPSSWRTPYRSECEFLSRVVLLDQRAFEVHVQWAGAIP